jgi:hypothetical protein
VLQHGGLVDLGGVEHPLVLSGNVGQLLLHGPVVADDLGGQGSNQIGSLSDDGLGYL